MKPTLPAAALALALLGFFGYVVGHVLKDDHGQTLRISAAIERSVRDFHELGGYPYYLHSTDTFYNRKHEAGLIGSACGIGGGLVVWAGLALRHQRRK